MPSFRPGLRASLGAALALLAVSPDLCVSARADTGGALVARYAAVLGSANARLPQAARRDMAERLLLLSSYYKLDPSLLAALVTVESSWRARAVSPVGALGYGQLMPGTASSLRVDALEPYENLDGTARYLRRMLNRYAGREQETRTRLALASYNAGAGAVDRYHGVPPYRETRAYVANVLRLRNSFAASAGMRLPNDPALLLAHVASSQRAHAARIASSRQRTAHRPPVRAAKKPHRTPYLDVPDPDGIALATPPPVRYERSRSFFARLLGLRHRVPATTPATTQAGASGATADVRDTTADAGGVGP